MSSYAKFPHVLTLRLVHDEFDPDTPNYSDDADLTCPYEPSGRMPCAMWEPCGCDPVAYEQQDQYWVDDPGITLDPAIGNPGSGPCPSSATGEHRYIEGEPCRPVAQCWVKDWEVAADSISEFARGAGWGPGRYEISVTWNGDAPDVELWTPETGVAA